MSTSSLHQHTKVIATCFAWYAVSAVSSQITKRILNEFPFPLALGEFQFLVVLSLCLLTMAVIARFPRIHAMFPPGSVPALGSNSYAVLRPDRHALMTVLPLGVFQFLGKLFSHSATALVPVSTVAGVKTLSPLILVSTYRVLYKVAFPLSTYLSLMPLVLGILLIVVADTKDTLVTTTASNRYIGIGYAALSLVVFVAQNIYGKTVFTYNQKHVNNHAELALASSDSSDSSLSSSSLPVTENQYTESKELEQAKREQSYELEVEKNHLNSFPKIRNKYDKLTLLLYCSSLGLILSIPWFLFIEFPHFVSAFNSIEENEAQLVYIPWKLLLINGVSHYFQSLIAFHLLGAIPTVSYSIASMMKKITIIVVSMLYTGHTVSFVQGVGLFLTGLGLYSYDRWGGKSSSRPSTSS